MADTYQEKQARRQRETGDQIYRMSDMFRRPEPITAAEKAAYDAAQAKKKPQK